MSSTRFYFVVIPTTSLLTLKACCKLLVHIQRLSISFKEGLSIKLRIQGFYSRRILQYVGIVPVDANYFHPPGCLVLSILGSIGEFVVLDKQRTGLFHRFFVT